MTSNNYQFGDRHYKGSVDSGFQEPIDTIGSHEIAMEINSFTNMGRRDLTQTSPLASPELARRQFRGPPELYQDQHLQREIANIKQQQQLQHQFLLQQYEQQRQQLEQEHEKQLHEHIKLQRQHLEQEHQKQVHQLIKGYFEQQQQKKLEQQQRIEKELLEKERLEQIKNKKKTEESAVASTEVKQKLHEFVLTKKQREAAVRELTTGSPPQFRHPWVPNQGSLEQSSPPQSNLSPPYPPGMLGKYDDDFPLRKTASEPNILKVRSALKQKLETRRIITHSPLVRRRDKGPLQLKRKTPLSIETGVCSSNPDSGPNSPAGSSHGALPNGSLSSLHSKEDNGTYPFPFRPGLNYPGTDLSLYTSPSMPNISLGRPPTSGPSSVSGSTSSSVASEEELRAMTARLGMPIASHLLPNALPGYFPSLPVIDGEFPPGTSQAYLAAAAAAAASGGKISSPLVNPYSIPPSGTEAPTHPAHRLSRHRPLGRTHSAPLPLGHPVFQQQQHLLQQHQHDQFIKENSKLYLKQHIRQTVLQRTVSKSHMENVDEETEVKLAQEMKESRDAESIVSDSKMDESSSELEKQQRDREAFLGQQREIIKPRHKGPSHHRPLSRTQSSPLVTFSVLPQQPQETGPVSYTFTTGLAYDTIMLKHQCTCGNNMNHLEHAGRIQSIWARLTDTGLVTRCERVRSRKASTEELQSCHTHLHTLVYGTNPLSRQKLLESSPMRFCLLPCGGVGVDSDTVWNDLNTSNAAKTATGCVIELALRVAAGDLKNGYAIVRPPGHHAEAHQAMGFCFFNSIAIAAKQLQEKAKLDKILIIDWDVHHGNGTQQMFYMDNHVLYISIHRHDSGNFFPGTGAPEECGSDEGLGFNVNIAFGGALNPPMADAEYLTAFRTIVMPIAREFGPDMVLVSAGFDAAKGHTAPLGGYEVTAEAFGHMTRELMSLAGGKVVLALEGGYDIPVISEASEMCVKALLGDELPSIKDEELHRPSCKPALETLESTIRIQMEHWPCIKRYLGTISYSLMEAQKREMEEADTVTALASLSMVPSKNSSVEQQESEPMEEGT
ncbi:histone deacetylase 4-like isoform X3 [Haliotis asinina]|uniref:histone deacetylase 4-like isoform X3 n=1 Tax=Haliotis asinina TaxID=109174 RepID=UPI003531851D